jgi:flagellar motility protein MotE (MotC chaperone)
MVRFLQSAWMTMLIGGLLFFATTAALLKPNKFQVATATADDSKQIVSNVPSWKFRNPDMDQWIEEIKQEKETLDAREQQLKDLEMRLNAERQEISAATQTVSQLQTDFDKNVVQLNAQDENNLKRQAKLIASMSPEGAAATLNQMSDDDVVRILFTMKADDASLALDTLSKLGKDQAKRAATIIERMRRTLPPTTALSN